MDAPLPSLGFGSLIRDEQLRPWREGIHIATGTARFMGVPIWNTMAVMELDRPGELVVWNPIALTDALRASLRELERTTGRRVTTLLAAHDYHHRALRSWQHAFPDAETFLVSERSSRWRNGPRREWFVLHRRSKSLLIGDMFFLNAKVTWMERMLLRFRVGFALNAAGFRTGDAHEREVFLRDVLAWDFEQALTVHGRASAHGAAFIREALRDAVGAVSP